VATPEPLRYGLFRKRRSLKSVLSGEGHFDRSSPLNLVQGQKNSAPRTTTKSENYMSDLPEGYTPHPGSVENPQSSYQPYDGTVSPSIAQRSPQGISRGFLPTENELAEISEGQAEHEDDFAGLDFFEHQANLLNVFEKQYLDAGSVFVDAAAVAQEILIAQQEALHSEPEMSALETVLADHNMDEVDSLADPMLESLEDGIMAEDMEEGPAYDDCVMTQEVFEEQMCEASEQMEPGEPQADMLECEDEMMPEEMDEMIDSSMMPGFYGPMPMGPGLDPGPGGPP